MRGVREGRRGSYRKGFGVEKGKLVDDEEDQPAKYGEQEQDLRDEFHKDAVIALEMAAGEREIGRRGKWEVGRLQVESVGGLTCG